MEENDTGSVDMDETAVGIVGTHVHAATIRTKTSVNLRARSATSDNFMTIGSLSGWQDPQGGTSDYVIIGNRCSSADVEIHIVGKSWWKRTMPLRSTSMKL